MGKLLNLAVYNPAILSDEDFLAGFVARSDLSERLLGRLRETSAARLAKHYLILGQRGMGKTSLLRRLALGVRGDPALSAAVLPLTFREEQYNIHNLHIFWCNCLDALGDWFEKSGQMDKAAEIDRDVAALARVETDPEGQSALEVFRHWTKREKKRALLLLDNVDLILDGITRYQWSLRRALQLPGGMIVVGASAGYMEATSDKGAAFYDFFQVVVLEKLGENELLACLRRLAEVRGEEGRKVLRTIDADPGRLRALYNLTGGNPRTLILLYLLLELDADGDVLTDLERLLDQATVLYKARVEDLAPQARVVLDAVALSWDPRTAADLAESTSLETSAVSAQLDRLQKDGVIEKVSLSSTPRAAFQLSERFFNIWYLMRHGPRRLRNRLRWLAGFLREFYSPKQLTDRARDLLTQTNEHSIERGQYYLALSDALEDTGWRHLLGREARMELERYAATSGRRLKDVVDPSELPAPVTAEDWRVQGNLLHVHLKRYEEAEASYRRAIDLDPNYARPWNGLGNLLQYHLNRYEEAETAYRRAIELDPKIARPWHDLGNLLQDYLNRYEEAEAAYRRAIELDPKSAWSWNRLGNLLQYHLNRYKEAEAAYRRAIEVDPRNARLWNNLGYLLLYFLDRQDEAEWAYQEALSLKPGDLILRSNLFAIHLLQPNRRSETDVEFESIIPQHSSQGAGLLRAIRAISADNFGEAAPSFENALAGERADIFDVYQGFVLLFLRLVAVRGYGDKLLNWLDERGITDRYWPLRVAFDAYLHGKAKLMDVNPEVRVAASRIYEWLASARSKTDDDRLKSAPTKRSRRKLRDR